MMLTLNSTRRWALSGAALATLAFAGAANAQTDSALANSDSSVGAIQEIVVTAEKRETTIQRTPLAVAAVGQDTLTRQGVTQMTSLLKVVPDLNIQTVGPGATVAVRGVYTNSQGPTAESAVAVHLDGAYLSKTPALEGFLFDLQRIEVAKGPQGTLYGRNANGGAINIVTNKAVLGEKSAAGDLELGSYNLVRTTGNVNVPLTDNLAVRAAFQTYSHQGYMKSGLDDADQHSARLSLRWRPAPADQFWMTIDYAKIGGKGRGTPNVIESKSLGTYYVPTNRRDDTFYHGDPSNPDSEHRRTAQVYRLNSENIGVTAQNDYDMGFATWTTQLAYRQFDSDPLVPGQEGQGPLLALAGVGSFPQSGRTAVPARFDSWSVESRLTSASSEPLAWVVGVYGFKGSSGGTRIQYNSQTGTTPAIQIANLNEKTRSGALFGQLTYTPPSVDKLHIVAGARYTADKKEAEGIFTQFGNVVPYAAGPNAYANTWDAFTYKAGLSYDVTNRSMLFANYSTGYKSGGYGYGPGINLSVGPLLDPETIKAYEVGSKNRFFGNRLQVNLEGFVYKYKNFETGLTLLAGGVVTITDTTAGSATFKGLGADIQFLPTNADTFTANVSIVDARYDDFHIPLPVGVSLIGASDQSGQKIPTVPNWTGNASYSHVFKVGNGSLEAQAFAILRGPVQFTLPTIDPIYGVVRLRGHPQVTGNLSLRYQPEGADWSVTGYVNNVTDKLYTLREGYSTTTHLRTGQFNEPRVFGVIFSAKIN